MKITSRFNKLILTILAVTQFASCNTSVQDMTIPTDNNDITEVVETLGVSAETFETYLIRIGMTYDDYIANLNAKNQTPETFKETIEQNYDCTFDEYIKTFIMLSHDGVPDENYTIFESEYSIYNAYIHTSEINDEKTLLKNNIAIYKIEENQDVFIFDAIIDSNGDFGTYIDAVKSYTGCTSIELSDIALFGSYGITKPKEPNACLDNFFICDTDTNEIIERLSVPIITLHFDDKDDITYGLSNELGILFKTTGANSIKKMSEISNLKLQIRHVK